MATQSVRIGWRPYVNLSITASSLWNSIYSVYNADVVGSSSLKTSLVSVYNGESNTNDSKGMNNGTAQGGLTYTTGKIGNAFSFNGSNAYVKLTTDTMKFAGDFSISAWCYFSGASANTQTIFSNLTYDGTYGYGYYLYYMNNTLTFQINNSLPFASGGNVQLNYGVNIFNGWHLVTVTRKSSTGTKMYLNGNLVANNTSTYNPNYHSNMIPSIGSTDYGTTYNGLVNYYSNSGTKIDALNIWTKELTASEVSELYNSGNGAQYIGDNFYKPTTSDALNTYNGTAVGGLTYGLGKVGTSFVFNGTNSYVSLPNNTFKFTGNFSVSLWFYCKTSSNVQTLINGYDYTGSASGGWILVVFGTGNFLDFQTYINTQATSKSRYQVGFNTSAYNNQWVHITLTRVSSTSTKIYINGTEASGSFIKGSVADNPTYLTNCYSEIGGDFVTSGGLINPCDNGTKIDAVNVWQKELTASEITELYNSGNGKQYPN